MRQKQRKFKRIFVIFMLQDRVKKECHKRTKLSRFSRNINTLTSKRLVNLYITEFK